MVVKLVFYYMLSTVRQGVPPWYFFQLNAEYFNSKKGIFSKIDLDKYIPPKWRLEQSYLSKDNLPKQYPVFIKPEWGQNACGIELSPSQDALEKFIEKMLPHKVPYIVQALAKGEKEYEIFYIQDPNDSQSYITLTITEVINHHEQYPINSVYNKHTHYHDRTAYFTEQEQSIIKQHLAQLPCFRIARIALKTHSQQALLAGDFKIIEINLFTPFPLNLLDKTSGDNQHKFIKDNMYRLATLSRNIPQENFKPYLFFKKVRRHYQIK